MLACNQNAGKITFYHCDLAGRDQAVAVRQYLVSHRVAHRVYDVTDSRVLRQHGLHQSFRLRLERVARVSRNADLLCFLLAAEEGDEKIQGDLHTPCNTASNKKGEPNGSPQLFGLG